MNIVPMQVTLMDHMGSDLTVCNAARVSFAKESDLVDMPQDDGSEPVRVLRESDRKLISYLATHNHWTPFGHCFAQFRIKAPIFVARQLVKHQIGLVWNEESRRYIDSEPEFWFPEVWRGRPAGSIKQGSGEVIQHNKYAEDRATNIAIMALAAYNQLLEAGVAPEQARMVLPLNTMTEWIWSGSLAAFARVCKLRLDPHAQAETRKIAILIDDEMEDLFPVSWEALTK